MVIGKLIGSRRRCRTIEIVLMSGIAVRADGIFVELIDAIKKHVWSFNHHHYGIDNSNAETQEALSNTFNCEPEELRGYIEMSSQSLIENTIMKIVRDIE